MKPSSSASSGGFTPLAFCLRDERDVVSLCRRIRSLADQVGLDRHASQRLSTTTYEVGSHLLEGQPPSATAMVTLVEGSALQVEFHAAVPVPRREQIADRVRPLHSIVHRLSLLDCGDEILVRFAMHCHDRATAALRPGNPETQVSEPASLEQAYLKLRAELQDANRSLVAVYAELDDRAERLKRRTEDLAAASRAKEEFLATLSHELRTPLNAMLGWTRLLRSRRLDGPMAERALETIERNARLQEQLISDILDVSRIVTGKARLELRPIALAPILAASVETVRPAGDAKGVVVQTTIPDEPGQVLGDPDRLQQVFWNLLANAIKFTPPGGAVEVTLEPREHWIVVTVSDTGEGIAPGLLPFIFDRFWQRDTSVTRPHGGLGLGLSIVRHIVEMHGGNAAVDSAGPGRGASFTVTLPMH